LAKLQRDKEDKRGRNCFLSPISVGLAKAEVHLPSRVSISALGIVKQSMNQSKIVQTGRKVDEKVREVAHGLTCTFLADVNVCPRLSVMRNTRAASAPATIWSCPSGVEISQSNSMPWRKAKLLQSDFLVNRNLIMQVLEGLQKTACPGDKYDNFIQAFRQNLLLHRRRQSNCFHNSKRVTFALVRLLQLAAKR
jgi:hypothetical protein